MVERVDSNLSVIVGGALVLVCVVLAIGVFVLYKKRTPGLSRWMKVAYFAAKKGVGGGQVGLFKISDSKKNSKVGPKWGKMGKRWGFWVFFRVIFLTFAGGIFEGFFHQNFFGFFL